MASTGRRVAVVGPAWWCAEVFAEVFARLGPGTVHWGGIEFIARSKGSGRGFTVDDLVLDEAQELDEFAYAALLPTLSAAPSGNPQQIICGTPPGPRDNGEVFTRLRKDALGGKSRRTLWVEWSMDSDADLDDRGQWAQANPALGIRLNVDVIEDERAAMDDETFRRERGGVWVSAAGAVHVSRSFGLVDMRLPGGGGVFFRRATAGVRGLRVDLVVVAPGVRANVASEVAAMVSPDGEVVWC